MSTRATTALLAVLGCGAAFGQAPLLSGDLDRGFDDRFGFPALDLFTTTVAASERAVYIGGSFDKVARLPYQGLVRWDGRRFHSMNLSGSVSAIAIGRDEVFVGGNFNKAGEAAVRNLARWNETSSTWSAVSNGEGPKDEDRDSTGIGALAVAGGSLFAAGEFASLDGVAAPGIARWDGTRWSAPARAIDGSIYALAIAADGRLVAGGEFRRITNNEAPASTPVLSPFMILERTGGRGLAAD